MCVASSAQASESTVVSKLATRTLGRPGSTVNPVSAKSADVPTDFEVKPITNEALPHTASRSP
jgi:hypothetical protein